MIKIQIRFLMRVIILPLKGAISAYRSVNQRRVFRQLDRALPCAKIASLSQRTAPAPGWSVLFMEGCFDQESHATNGGSPARIAGFIP